MNFNEYQDKARKTAIYHRDYSIIYPALGLANEAGEVLGVIKKGLRDNTGSADQVRESSKKELGDVLWYLAILADDLDIRLQDVAADNLMKLRSRKKRGVIGGSGDDR